METTIGKKRKVIGWILSGMITAILLFSAMGKLTMPEMATNFELWGLNDWIIIIAFGEAVSALLFLFPRTNLLGVLLLSSHMGGAIIVHMSHGESFIVQSIILILIWVTGLVRNNLLLVNSKK